MRGWVRTKGRVAGACVAGAIALAGCGTATTGGSSVVTVTGRTLSIYASQPPGPPSAAVSDTLDAERLALQQAGDKAGNFTVRLIALHGRELSANARFAIEDQSTIAYLGELVPGTSQVSVEILNQQGVLEVSPADTAAYLTSSVPTVPASPTTFYPSRTTYGETFARVVPTTAQEARALVGQMQSVHAKSLYVASDGSQYGQTIAAEVRQAASSAGLSIAGTATQAGAVFYGASAASPQQMADATRALQQAAGANPRALLFVPSGLYDSAFVSALSPAVQQRLYVSSPGFLPRDLPAAGRTFESAFRHAYGHDPAPQAIFGYEAMAAVIAVLTEARAAAAQRAAVVSDFHALKNRAGAIGTYSLSAGDPDLAPFVLARVRGGQLVPFKFSPVSG